MLRSTLPLLCIHILRYRTHAITFLLCGEWSNSVSQSWGCAVAPLLIYVAFVLCLSILGTTQSTFLTVKSLADMLNVRVKRQGHFQCLISQITQYPFMLLTITFKNQSQITPRWHRGNLWPWSLQRLSHKACLPLPSLLPLNSSIVLK